MAGTQYGSRSIHVNNTEGFSRVVKHEIKFQNWHLYESFSVLALNITRMSSSGPICVGTETRLRLGGK